MSEAQWADIERTVRESIASLPDADEFKPNDIGRIITRVRRVNRDVIDSVQLPAPAVSADVAERFFKPVYSSLIGEVTALCIELVRLEQQLQ